MVEGVKLARIKYNNKEFDIYSCKDHIKCFCEVKINNSKEELLQPNLEDLINLNLIYNNDSFEKNDIKKFDSNNKSVKNLRITYDALKKVRFGLTFITIPAITVGLLSYMIDKTMGNSSNEEISSINTDFVGDPYLSSTSELENYGLGEVTFSDLKTTVDNNSNFQGRYKELVHEYIELLERKLPDIDIRMLNANFKDIVIEEYNGKTLPYSTAIANYNSTTNKLRLCVDYDEETIRKIFFHECSHVLTNYYSKNVSNGFVLKKFEGKDDYGISIDEGLVENIATFLLSDFDTFEEYINGDVDSFWGYRAYVAPLTYNLLQLTFDEFNFYDYVDGKIYDYTEILKKYDMDVMIDYLDVIEKNLGNASDVKLSPEFNEKQKELKTLIDSKKENGKIGCVNTSNFDVDHNKIYVVNYNVKLL